MRIIGDVHGKMNAYTEIISDCDNSIQVGDFGVGFVDIPNLSANHRFIRGNHDNPTLAKAHQNYIPDGTFENGVFYVGGAYSIDMIMRTPGYDWWYDEQCSDIEFEQIFYNYAKAKPDILITHDCPRSFAEHVIIKKGYVNGKIVKTRTGYWLEKMFQNHRPKAWYFGHWHVSIKETYKGTMFRCLKELEYEDV